MSWKEPGGGGPWGGGQGPWGRGPGRPGGPTPPDFDDLFRKGQERIRRIFPPGGFGGGRGILLAVIAIIVLWALTGIYKVRPGRSRRGAALRQTSTHITQPGLNYHLPSPIEFGADFPGGDPHQPDRDSAIRRRWPTVPLGQPRRLNERKPDADRRREHHRRQFLGVLADQGPGKISCSTSGSRRHGEDGGGIGDARGDRAIADPARRCREPPGHRRRTRDRMQELLDAYMARASR